MRSFIAILALSSSAFATTYNCSTFALPAGNTADSVNGFNNAGTVSGSYHDASGNHHGFIYNPGTGNFTSVDFPGGLPTALYAINNNGTSVGQSGNSVFTVDSSGNFHPIPIASGFTIKFVFGINDAGDVGGILAPSTGEFFYAVIHPDGSFANYGGTQQGSTPPGSLNNALQMVENPSAVSPFIRNSDGSTIPIQPPYSFPGVSGLFPNGSGLNNSGTFAGTFNGVRGFTRDSSGNYGEVFCPGVSTTHGPYPWNAINDNGIIASIFFIATPLPGLSQTTLTPSSVTFPSAIVGQPSQPQTITVANSGNARLDIGSIEIAQPPPGFGTPVFTVSGCLDPNTGTASLDPGSSCTLTVNATPQSSGQQTGTLYIEDSSPGSPHAVSLSVTGASPPPPTCTVGATNPGPPASVSFTMQDTNSGLQSIVVTQTSNANTSVQSFQTGTTTPVNASATQINTGQSASVQFKVTNVAGSSTTCGSNFASGSGGGPAVWTGLGGSIVGRPSVSSNSDGRLEVIAWGSDSAIDDISQSAAGGAWNGFTSLGGYITGNAVIAANQNGDLEAFARGGDNALWTTAQSSPGAWSGSFATLGGALISDAAVGINSNGTLDVFVLGTDNGLWHNTQTSPGGSWSGWSGLGGSFTGLPAVVANQDGRLQVFARGTDNSLWTLAQTTPAGSWSAPVSLGGFLKSNPAAALNANGIVQAFVVGGDTSIWTIAQASAGSSGFGSFSDLGGSVDADPSIAVNQDGRLEVFVLGGDNALWHNSQTQAGSSNWSGWTTLQGSFVGAPSAIRASNGEIGVFVRNSDNTLGFIQQTSPGSWN